MSTVQLFGVGLRGKSPVVSAQKRINLYYDIQKDSDKTRAALHGTPGLASFCNLGASACRFLRAAGDFLYALTGATVWRVNAAGVSSSLSTTAVLTTTGRCYAADNGTQLMFVDGTYGYIITLSSGAVARITDADFPTDPAYVTWQDGYFIVATNSGRYYISALDNGTSWDALDFRAAESEPDTLLAAMADHGEVALFGETTTEFHSNTGAADFPYSPIRGASNEYGLAASASLAKFGDSLMFLGRTKQGQVQVMRVVQYTPQPVSTPDLDTIINGYSTVLDATAFSYQFGGHLFYQINFTSGDQSWLFDAQSGEWSELQSDGGRHWADHGTAFNNNFYVADYRSGLIYRLDSDTYTDNGTAIIREAVSRHIVNGFEKISVHELYIDMETGVGLTTGQGSDPQVMLQVSKDNGRTWGNELWRDLGAIGRYLTRVIWRRLGYGRDFLFRFRVSDPVKVVIAAAAMEVGK